MYCPVCDAAEGRRGPEDWPELLGRGRDGEGEGVKCGFAGFFPGIFDVGEETPVGWTGCGLGRGGGDTSSIGTRKQQK